MINVEDLLKPVAPDKPCGEDFTYHPSFQNLESLARGKPETQFSPAEEPDWKEVRESALEVLSQSKHLGAATILTRALLKIGGLEGLRDGIAVARGLTEMYWPDIFPKLDPDDNNDPTERLNILNNLSSPAFVLEVTGVVVCNSPAMGRITLRQVLDAKEKVDKGAAEGAASGAGPDLNQIQAAFRDAGPEAATVTLGLADAALGHAQAIESFLDMTLGAGRGVNFDALTKALTEMKRAVEPYTAASGAPAEAQESGSTAAPGPTRTAGTGGPGMSGTIQSRADVVKALGLICDFYRQNEPSSPVPLILQRAQRLVDADFMTIMTDLTPDALGQLQVITGAKTDK
ncbi:MAG TPA: type VI secretion system protein TssA [Verrucomicrobiae bacterium]|nr:type VI secretion system protein TssA [Verrucomicrobiae bacterium]